ncbi:MAG: hypothetical protein H0T78_10430 [Longispora sp.]|nr:hypothetical protein [Longispora sp. (in: high G+C Gram-positive bacteria)]
MHTEWRCDEHGVVLPFRIASHPDSPVITMLTSKSRVPVWCPWPAPPAWTVTGLGWVGDDRSGVRATAVACSGPAPLEGGPADMIFIAEEPGVGLGARFAGLETLDPGPGMVSSPSDTKVRAAGHPTPLWTVDAPRDRSVYVGEAKGLWLFAIVWPSMAGYLLTDDVVLHDLSDSIPGELLFGAPSPYLHEGPQSSE